jgi:creatinine amidohydrolase
MNEISDGEVTPLMRLSHIPNLFTGLSWYANYPHHYVGNAKAATSKKGKILQDFDVEELATFIKNVKEDITLPILTQAFFKETTH